MAGTSNPTRQRQPRREKKRENPPISSLCSGVFVRLALSADQLAGSLAGCGVARPAGSGGGGVEGSSSGGRIIHSAARREENATKHGKSEPASTCSKKKAWMCVILLSEEEIKYERQEVLAIA